MAGRIRTCGAPRFRRPLYRLSYGHALSGRGWTRTSSLLCVKQALFALELLALGAPGQGLEPRSPRSERGVLPDWTIPDCVPNHVFYATRLPFDPGSPRLGVLRGGALEPGALALSVNCQAKAAAYSAANCRARIAQRNLSLSGGASNSVFASQAGHHPSVRGCFAPDTTKATLSGRPRFELVCSQTASSHTSRRGLRGSPTGARHDPASASRKP